MVEITVCHFVFLDRSFKNKHMLQLKIDISTNDPSTSFYFKDVTPLYNAISDPTGYDLTGVNNFDPGTIDTARLYLDVTLPDTSIISLTIPAANFDIANIGGTGLITYEILATDLGFSSTLQDGIYKFSYKIYSQDGSKSFSCAAYIAVTFAICCCLEKKLVDITLCSSCSDHDKNKRISNLYDNWVLQSKINHLLACHNNAGAQEAIDFLTNYCNIKNCDSCN